MSDYEGRERRRHHRYPVTLKICYTNMDTFFYDYAINISKGGVFIRTEQPLPIGSRVRIKFAIPGTQQEIETEGQVVRSVHGGPGKGEFQGMGISFGSLKEQDVALISELWKESTKP